MRRIVSLLLIARLIQRLINGSRRGSSRRTHAARPQQPQRPAEPPQGSAPRGGQSNQSTPSSGRAGDQ